MDTTRHTNFGVRPPSDGTGDQMVAVAGGFARLHIAIEQQALAFTRVARAVRQIIVLEQEVLGLRAYSAQQFRAAQEQSADRGPSLVELLTTLNEEHEARERAERSDLRDRNDVRDGDDLYEADDLDDYDDIVMNDGGLGDAIQSIRTELATPDAAPPPNDRPSASSAMPPSSMSPGPIRRRAMRGHGPPGG